MRADVGNYQQPQAAPAPMATPNQRPVAPPLGNEDMQDRLISAMASERGIRMPQQAIPTASVMAPATAAVPQMPVFTGSPRQIAESQNRWRQAQSKVEVSLM